MGQRFQIITNTDGNINVYHCQWLWGLFAIRRLGTAIKNFIKYNKENGYRSFEDYLKGSFYGKPYDMNSFDRYFNDSFSWNDNKEICSYEKNNKRYKNMINKNQQEIKDFLEILNYYQINKKQREF